MPDCLICKNEVNPFISFGRMPIANGFLTPDQYADEYFFELQVALCSQCSMVQLTELVDRDRLFHDQYAYFSSISVRMANHFKGFAGKVQNQHLRTVDPFVVEIGSNDGILLQHFAKAGIRHLGVEPSANVAEAARQKGVQTICQFFDEDLAHDTVAGVGQADVIMAANVMCHIPYLHSVFRGVKVLLKARGFLIFEDPYLGDIMEKASYDQIYDEHAFYFSATSIRKLCQLHELELVDVEPQNVHGGSMRYTISHRGAVSPSPRVDTLLTKEDALGLHRPEAFQHLRQRIEASRDALGGLLHEIKTEGGRVVGYGATSKSTTVINYCGITPELLEFISDTTPIKQGKFSPGAHIPIRAYGDFNARYPEYALLFAWNHAEEIFDKEQAFRQAGGKWLVYVPEVKVLS